MSRHSLPRSPRQFIGRVTAFAAAMCVAIPLTTTVAATPAAAAPYDAPDEIASEYYGALLRHTRWVETVWDEGLGAYQLRDFNFAVVLGNAVLLTHGEYDEELAGIPEAELRDKTIATIEHYAALNRNVDPDGNWGKRLFWDSTFQSYFLLAGNLMWDELDGQTRTHLETIAAEQSRYTADLEYGRDSMSGGWTADWPTGKYQGDTAQEEVGVYTQALAPGLAWAPDDADADRWAEQLSDWGRNAAGQPTADLNNPAVVGGKAINTNTMQTIHDTYLVENHGSFGPHYQSDLWRSGGRNAIHFLLNDEPLPEILTQQPNSAELWESIKLVMSNQGEPFMPMVADREFLYGRDVLPIAFLGQVLRDPDAVRAEANLAAALEDYQAYAPTDRLTKFSGEPKYEPEARAEIAISYLLHVEAAESDEGPVEPTPQDEFFERLSGVRDFGETPGLTVHQSENAWAAAGSRQGFVKFPWVPGHNSWLFHISGATPFLYPSTSATVDTRETTTYSTAKDGFEGTASLFAVNGGYAGQVTLPTGSALYASSGVGVGDGTFTVRNIDMNGYAGLDGSRTYTTAEGTATEALPPERPIDPADAQAARIDEFDFEPVTARYVRMQGEQGHPQYGYSMYSFHVYGADAGSGDDLAAGATATASSQDAGGNRQASRVTDGVANTRWAVSAADRTRGDSWIQVDLGEEQEVGGVTLAWESSAGVRYDVQTSTDGVNWTTQTSFDGGDPADVNVARMDTIDLDEPEARYVRMQGVQGDHEYGYSLYHFRVFDTDGTNVAAGQPATASSFDGSSVAGAATDGSATTRWAVARDERSRADSWIQVDLGEPIEVAQVQLGWESAAGRMYRIQTSLDGETWTDAEEFRFTGDQVLSTDGSWINVEGTAGFVVRGSDAPITVSVEEDERHVVRLADAGAGTTSPLLVEMVAGDAAATSSRASASQPSSDDSTVLVSTVDGYVSLFNLSGEDVSTQVTLPYVGDEVSLFEGEQRLGSDSSELDVAVPAGTSMVLAPRAVVSRDDAASGTLTATVVDGGTVQLESSEAGAVSVSNVETGEEQVVEVDGDSATLTFEGASAFPDPDLALSRLTFPASVLPEGMSSPAAAVDGDVETSWVPGPDGRMVIDLGSTQEIGSVAALWDGEGAPDATVSISDDGINFRDVGSAAARSMVAPTATRDMVQVTDVEESARYVALSTSWSDGDPGVHSLRVLPMGVEQEEPTGPIEGDLPSWRVGEAASGALSALGFPAPMFEVTEGALPAGVTLDGATGAFGGEPTVAGDFEFTVVASNGVGVPTSRSFSGSVLAATETPGPGEGGGDGGGETPGGGDGGGDGTGGPGAEQPDDGELSNTGADVGWLLSAVAALLLAGLTFTAIGARRQAGGRP